MSAIRIQTTLDSVTPHLPQLGPLVGRTVEIVVTECSTPTEADRFWVKVNAEYAALRADPQGRAEEQADWHDV